MTDSAKSHTSDYHEEEMSDVGSPGDNSDSVGVVVTCGCHLVMETVC